jgi:hypothetical protein
MLDVNGPDDAASTGASPKSPIRSHPDTLNPLISGGANVRPSLTIAIPTKSYAMPPRFHPSVQLPPRSTAPSGSTTGAHRPAREPEHAQATHVQRLHRALLL